MASNLAGNQITNFLKQYAEYGLQFPVAGFGFDTVVAWGAGKGNFSGIWPLVWHHLVDTPSSKKYVDAFQKRYGKLPDNQSWGDYNSLKIVAQSMNEMKSADPQKLAEHLRKGAKFDVMKAREAYFRPYDNQMVMEMYAVRAKEPAKMKDQWDIYDALGTVPGSERRHGNHRAAEGRHLQDRVIVAGHVIPVRHAAAASCWNAVKAPRVQFVFLLEQVLNGLLVGAYYLLIALGLSLIFALGGIVNLAHGGVLCDRRLSCRGARPTASVLSAHSLRPRSSSAASASSIERLLFRRFYRSDPISEPAVDLRACDGDRAGPAHVFGASPLPFSIPPELRGQIFVGDFIYPRYRLIILGVAVAAVTATWFIVYRTAFGRVVRAGVQNPDIVGALGISLAPYMTAIAALGVGLAGLAGVLLAPIQACIRRWAPKSSPPLSSWS